MLAWLQELRQGGGFDYAGCLSLPRLLSYKSRAPPPLTLVILLHKTNWDTEAELVAA